MTGVMQVAPMTHSQKCPEGSTRGGLSHRALGQLNLLLRVFKLLVALCKVKGAIAAISWQAGHRGLSGILLLIQT